METGGALRPQFRALSSRFPTGDGGGVIGDGVGQSGEPRVKRVVRENVGFQHTFGEILVRSQIV